MSRAEHGAPPARVLFAGVRTGWETSKHCSTGRRGVVSPGIPGRPGIPSWRLWRAFEAALRIAEITRPICEDDEGDSLPFGTVFCAHISGTNETLDWEWSGGDAVELYVDTAAAGSL